MLILIQTQAYGGDLKPPEALPVPITIQGRLVLPVPLSNGGSLPSVLGRSNLPEGRLPFRGPGESMIKRLSMSQLFMCSLFGGEFGRKTNSDRRFHRSLRKKIPKQKHSNYHLKSQGTDVQRGLSYGVSEEQ